MASKRDLQAVCDNVRTGFSTSQVTQSEYQILQRVGIAVGTLLDRPEQFGSTPNVFVSSIFRFGTLDILARVYTWQSTNTYGRLNHAKMIIESFTKYEIWLIMPTFFLFDMIYIARRASTMGVP